MRGLWHFSSKHFHFVCLLSSYHHSTSFASPETPLLKPLVPSYPSPLADPPSCTVPVHLSEHSETGTLGIYHGVSQRTGLRLGHMVGSSGSSRSGASPLSWRDRTTKRSGGPSTFFELASFVGTRALGVFFLVLSGWWIRERNVCVWVCVRVWDVDVWMCGCRGVCDLKKEKNQDCREK